MYGGGAKGELDPADPRNKDIVNLGKVPRNSQGKVHYEVEWFMLRPADSSKGNQKLPFEVTNRGRKFLMNWIMDAPTQAASAVNNPATVTVTVTVTVTDADADAGNALFFR